MEDQGKILDLIYEINTKLDDVLFNLETMYKLYNDK